MKKLYTIVFAFAFIAGAFAQAPEKMSYQAVIRDAGNNLVTCQSVGMQISILRDSASGSAVYTETQTLTTNANGLVTLEIGAGTSGDDFSTIGWANGTYFIKTETDPTGGTNYTITGTSQFLSVPYALYAKTAETATGTISETDPIYTASNAAHITAADITNLNNLSGVNKGDQDLSAFATKTVLGDSTAQLRNEIPAAAGGSETKVTAGDNVTVTGEGTTASPYVINAIGATTFTIGQSYQGGIIFWLDVTGQHGLIAATTDQSTSAQWYNGTYILTNAVRDGICAGLYNTECIIAKLGAGSYAATICANFQNGGYGDWYLPSKYELYLLYAQKAAVGGFAGADYWSSTEVENINEYAWIHDFDSGIQTYATQNGKYRVRAIRAF